MIRKHLLWLLPLAGIAGLMLFLARTADAPAKSGTVIVSPTPDAAPSPAPILTPLPVATETPKPKTVLIPEAPAKTADGTIVTRCTDPEC
ncbi:MULTISPECIES: hypothetical protein [unclassified Sphingomonas]|uniref:hypothetical protein n=1 Tax=unclassified Sphingomonas TaxID=196159 RepID=UPI0022B56EB7|nr:hypothetical protein [Sphingomonas sp. NIBR02145]WHU02115.1 hypothetical protein O3305_18275 [Sphingomonas sp. NIBR02145]